jgi:hypothetical protein
MSLIGQSRGRGRGSRPRRVKRVRHALGWLGWGLATLAGAEPVETRTYRETTDGESALRQWTLRTEGEGTGAIRVAASEFRGERFENRLAPDGDTLGWRAETAAGTIVAERSGRRLRLSGTLEGREFEKRVKLPALPWYQSIVYSLEDFARGGEEAVKFVTLHPREFNLITLRASREGVETIMVEGQEHRARRVSLRLAGWRAPFWSADYWFREADGRFLRYAGANGPPGTPETVVDNLTVPPLDE